MKPEIEPERMNIDRTKELPDNLSYHLQVDVPKELFLSSKVKATAESSRIEIHPDDLRHGWQENVKQIIQDHNPFTFKSWPFRHHHESEEGLTFTAKFSSLKPATAAQSSVNDSYPSLRPHITAYFDWSQKCIWDQPEKRCKKVIRYLNPGRASEIYNLNQNRTNSLNQDNNVIASDDFFEEKVDKEELIALEVKVEEIKECVNKNALNYEAALLELKRQVFKGNCNNPTGFFLKALRNGWGKSSPPSAVAQAAAALNKLKQKLEPTEEQMRSLISQFGEEKLIKDVIPNEEIGYPFVWCIQFGVWALPWWEVVGNFPSLK